MNKKELSDKTAFLWTLFGITLLLFIFQKLGNQVQWYLNMAGLVLANEVFGFLVSDKDTVKKIFNIKTDVLVCLFNDHLFCCFNYDAI